MFDVRKPDQWETVTAVVFDLDGTLYDPRAIRWRMLLELGSHALRGPRAWQDLRIISVFRRLREDLAEREADNISRAQYTAASESLSLPAERVEQTIVEWIYRRPLRHLDKGRFAHVEEVFERLRGSGRQVAVYSDYPVREKLAALGLEADLEVSADDSAVDRLKPHAKGLLHVLETLAVSPAQALMIGDRDDRDGEIARRTGVRYALKTRGLPGAPHEFASYADCLEGLSQ